VVWQREMSVLSRRCRRGGWCGIGDGMRIPRLPGDRNEGMCAVVALVDAVIAVAPVAFVTVVAFPVACIGIGFAHIAKDANLHPLFGVIFAHEYMWRCCGFCERRCRPAITMPNKDMRMLMVWRIASIRRLSFVTWPSSPPKTKPMLASLAETIATDTDVVLAIITPSAVVVQLILYAMLTTALA
jgi:hypothetical protein